MARGPKKIGLLDHMGGGNLGDDTTQTAVMYNIRSRWPDATIYGFSMNPADSESRHAIPSYPIRRRTWNNPDRVEVVGGGGTDKVEMVQKPNRGRRLLRAITAAAIKKPLAAMSEFFFLAKSLAIMRTLDIFVISGGGQLLDSWGGTWEYPYTILKWVSLARLSGTKCYFVNVGAGPLRHPLSRFFIRIALSLADYVSLRDQKSKSIIRKIGFKGEALVFPDCVYGMDLRLIDAGSNKALNQAVVGMSPMAYCDPCRYWIQDQGAYETFVRKFVMFGSWLSERYRLALFSTDVWFDAKTLDKVDQALKDQRSFDDTQLLPREPITTVEALLSHMSSMDYIVTCRFHGVVFAHLMNIPVIALSHHPKVTTLMADLGLSEYCLDIDTFDPESLKTAFARMVSDTVGIKARMAEKLAFYRSELSRQFDHLCSPEVIR